MSWAWIDIFWRWVIPYLSAVVHIVKASVSGVGGVSAVGSKAGIEYPPANGKILGKRAKHGVDIGSVTSMKIRSGPAGSGAVRSSGRGPSSSKGSDAETARLKVSTAVVLEVVMLTT